MYLDRMGINIDYVHVLGRKENEEVYYSILYTISTDDISSMLETSEREG